jgi:hypothetical protein
MAIGPQPMTAVEYQALMKRLQHERLDPHYMPSPEEWRKQMEQHGYVPPPGGVPGQPIPKGYGTQADAKPWELNDTPSCGDGAFDSRIRRTTIGIRAQDIAPTPPPSSTPQTKEPDTEHMWDMLVLAARSSRYGE